MGRHTGGYESVTESRRRRTRHGKTVAYGSLAGALVIAVLLAVGAFALVDHNSGCAEGTVTLHVVSTPGIGSAASSVATTFNDADHRVHDKCVHVTVTDEDAGDVMNSLSQQGPISGSIHSDVWIPDSSEWIDLTQSSIGGASRVSASGTSLASSPAVMAVPRGDVGRLGKRLGKPTWHNLLKAAARNAPWLDAQMLDPTRNATGMNALVMARSMLGSSGAGRAKLVSVVRTLQANVAPDTSALFATFRRAKSGTIPLLITSEQSVWSYNTTHRGTPAVAIYPSDGTPSLDYPYVLTTNDSDKVAAAQQFRTAMTSKRAKQRIAALGFRTSSGAATASITKSTGLKPARPKAVPTPDAGTVAGTVQAWVRLKLGTRMLTLMDVSGSMAKKVPGTDMTRMQATVQAALQGIRLFPPTSELGLWRFSTHLDGNRDWQRLVPLGPLNSRYRGTTRLKAIQRQYRTLKVKPTGDTGLYDTILAAFRHVSKTYQSDKINSVLVLTDGYNDDDHTISLRTLLTKLHNEYDPSRPVSIFAIGLGHDIDLGAMRKIAEATDGQAFATPDPSKIKQVFLEAVSRRVCSPTCG